MSNRMPFSAYILLAVLGLFTLIISASLIVFVDQPRLGYSYAVHSAIFFPFSRGIALPTCLGVLAAAGVVYVGHWILKRRQVRGVRVVPVWFALLLAFVLALYVKEVLQIDISWTPSEESVKISPT